MHSEKRVHFEVTTIFFYALLIWQSDSDFYYSLKRIPPHSLFIIAVSISD